MSQGAAIAGTPRRIQFGMARPEMIKVGKEVQRASAFDVREWFLRKLVIDRLTPEQIQIIEALIEDLELG